MLKALCPMVELASRFSDFRAAVGPRMFCFPSRGHARGRGEDCSGNLWDPAWPCCRACQPSPAFVTIRLPLRHDASPLQGLGYYRDAPGSKGKKGASRKAEGAGGKGRGKGKPNGIQTEDADVVMLAEESDDGPAR